MRPSGEKFPQARRRQRDGVGLDHAGRIETVRVVPDGSRVANYGFDVTPARLVTGLITERGVLAPTRAALKSL